MPHMLDGMAILPPVIEKDMCPICEKAPHPERTTTDKKEDKGCLASKPANLGCVPLVPIPTLPNYTTAAHHLIPAIQCLAQFPRLSQMAKAVGYDVNNKINGISLPTCGQGKLNSYLRPSDGISVKYSKLSENDKEDVAFVIMEGTGLQWHVGHHNWSMDAPLDLQTDGYSHPENYDKLVKRELRNLERDIKEDGEEICNDDEKESGEEVISRLNELSGHIRSRVVSWSRYFVSAKACKYSSQYCL